MKEITSQFSNGDKGHPTLKSCQKGCTFARGPKESSRVVKNESPADITQWSLGVPFCFVLIRAKKNQYLEF